jgi:hypothetical protein
MAKRQPHSVLGFLSGTIGETVHTSDGNVRKKAAVTGRKLSELQQEHKNRWDESKEYARIATSDPELNSWYAKLARKFKNQGAWQFAISDYCHPPVIGKVTRGIPGARALSRLCIDVNDRYKVQRVMVCLTAADGSAIEKGKAVFNNIDLCWDFDFGIDLSLCTDLKLTVLALDLPGNIVYRELPYPYFDTGPASVPGFSKTKKKKQYVKSQLRPRQL